VSPRQAELRGALDRVEQRVASACTAAGRSRDDVTVVVVTKTFPASDVRLLAGLGVLDVGESRDQEALAKAQDCADLALRWHFVGRLQSNKARSVAGYASVVHSLDRPSLVRPLGSGAEQAGRNVGALVQVSLDGDPARGGVPTAGVPELAAAVARQAGLTLRGVMAVPPIGADPAQAFEQLMTVAEAVRREHPAADWVSAGMSSDLEAAVGAGATHLRVGSAILGSRPSLR
jgi:pyridoxal phosphate enzyme (YggS family)